VESDYDRLRAHGPYKSTKDVGLSAAIHRVSQEMQIFHIKSQSNNLISRGIFFRADFCIPIDNATKEESRTSANFRQSSVGVMIGQ
jgi:hypothetical protein